MLLSLCRFLQISRSLNKFFGYLLYQMLSKLDEKYNKHGQSLMCAIKYSCHSTDFPGIHYCSPVLY